MLEQTEALYGLCHRRNTKMDRCNIQTWSSYQTYVGFSHDQLLSERLHCSTLPFFPNFSYSPLKYNTTKFDICPPGTYWLPPAHS